MQQQGGTMPLEKGCRFVPTDHELLNYYLKKKIKGEPLQSPPKITEAKIYEDHPSKIFDQAEGQLQEVGWDERGVKQGKSVIWRRYFFARLTKNNGEGSSTTGIIGMGGTNWKEAKKKEIKVRNGENVKIIGWKKLFNYVPNDDDNNNVDQVKWVMHEYSLLDHTNNHENWVLCCLTKKLAIVNDQDDDNTTIVLDDSYNTFTGGPYSYNDDDDDAYFYEHPECSEYLETLRNSHPELSEWCNTLAALYHKKLWHQLTLKLDQFIALAVFQAGDALIQLYHNFISDFETKINLLKLAHFTVIVSQQYAEKEAAIGYLEGLIEKLRATKKMRMEEAILYIKMQIALFKLEKGEQKECKNLMEDGKITLDSMTDIDPSVYASFYWVSSQYHKARRDFAEFYKNGLLYLAYTSVISLSESFKLDLAFDLSLSALLGENIYNFRELLAHPILQSLLGTTGEWLYYILEAFNNGDLVRYQVLCVVHKDALNAQPALVANERKLLEKINILCLMEIIFNRPSEDRTIPLKVIAERTRLSIEDVEYLLMKSLSGHLIEGIIDQVEGTVHVSWVQPRVLGVSQIKLLRDRLDSWVGKVHTALLSVKAETPDVFAS